MSTPAAYQPNDSARTINPNVHVAIVAARWNEDIIARLIHGAQRGLQELGLEDTHCHLFRCPGSYELPLIAKACAESGRFAGVIALGCVIRGETYHFELVADAASDGLLRVMLDTGVPCMMGVLTTETVDQAHARAADGPSNKGYECAYGLADMLWQLQLVGGPG